MGRLKIKMAPGRSASRLPTVIQAKRFGFGVYPAGSAVPGLPPTKKPEPYSGFYWG